MTPTTPTDPKPTTKPTIKGADILNALKRLEEKILQHNNTINGNFTTITTQLGTISNETAKIESIKSAVKDIKKLAESADKVVKEILVHGIDAHVVLDYLDEVTVENADGSVLVVSELGRGFAAWMAENEKQEHDKHPEIFENTWRTVGKVLAEMFDALYVAGEYHQYKRNFHSRSNVIIGRSLKGEYRHLEWSGRGVASKGKGKGKAKATARENTKGKGKAA